MRFLPFVVAATSLFFSVAHGALTVTNPDSSHWWVANSLNLLSWSCSDPSAQTTYTVIVFNPTVGALAGGLPIIAQLPNFDCSQSIPPNGDLVAGSNYTIALANILNRTDILAISEPFEIKPEGSVYPASATPTPLPSTSSGAGASLTSSSSSPSSSHKASALSTTSAPLSFGAAAALVLGALFA